MKRSSPRKKGDERPDYASTTGKRKRNEAFTEEPTTPSRTRQDADAYPTPPTTGRQKTKWPKKLKPRDMSIPLYRYDPNLASARSESPTLLGIDQNVRERIFNMVCI